MSMYEQADWTKFRNLETLCHKAGVPRSKLPALVAKELVDNALDCAGFCRVELTYTNGFIVQDEGPGFDVSDREIADMFAIRRDLKSSKILRKPSRGALGNGLRVVAGSVLGARGSLYVSTRGRALELTPQSSGETIAKRIGKYDNSGTEILVCFDEEELVVDDDTLELARQAIAMAPAGSRYEGGSSPYWYDPSAFFELLQAAKDQTVRQVIEQFDGCSELLSNFVDGKSQAATGFLTPSTKTAPAITSGSSCDPFNALHFFDALSISL